MKAKWVLSLFVLALVSSSFAVVIGDFENGSDDGWIPVAGRTTFTPTSIGATLGAGAMKVTVAPEWGNLMSKDVMALIPNLTQTDAKFSMDVSNMNSDGSITNWWGAIGLVLNTNAGWFQYEPPTPLNVTWDLSTQKMEWVINDATKAGLLAPGITYAEIFLYTNTQGASFYLDNLNIVPEPATMVLMGLGGLSLIRRKR